MSKQEVHWRDRYISASEAISDAFEVLKAYGARIAEWVLFFCLIANILEMFPLGLPDWFGTTVLAVQAITLDIAGFGLTSMGKHARQRGDEKAARTASGMGWTLISLMIITVSLIAVSHLFPKTKDFVAQADNVMILARVIVTVFYSHIVHSLRQASVEHDGRVSSLGKDVSSLRVQLDAKEQEVSSGQSQLKSVQLSLSSVQLLLDDEKEKVSSGQHKLDAALQRVDSLEEELSTGQGDTAGLRRELNEARQEAESLRWALDTKTREVEMMQADQAAVVALRREMNTAKLDAEDLRAQLSSAQSQLVAEQKIVSSLRKEVSSVQREKVSSKPAAQVSSGHKKMDTGHPTGQEKVVELDSRRKTGQGDLAKRIQQLLIDEPGLSGRAIATRLGCSPTTASEWKKFFEDGGQLDAVANG